MFGDRLKLARKKAGFSLRGLSEALSGEVSAQVIGKYERGEMMPRSELLIRLGQSLDASLDYLMSERVTRLEGVEFRKVSGTTVRELARVEEAVTDALERYLMIEEILDFDSAAWSPPKFGIRFLGEEDEGEVLAQDLRREWKLGIDPIPDMTALLEGLGIKVFLLPLQKGVSGLTCLARRSRGMGSVPAIVANREDTLESRRLSLGHELGHRLIDPISPVNRERAADVFAGAFLMPRDHLIREVGQHRKALSYRELIQLKHLYRIGAAALLARLHQVGIVDRSAFAYASRTRAKSWRLAEPAPLELEGEKGRHEAPNRFERLCYRALAERLIPPGKASELLRRPLKDVEREMEGPAGGDARRRRR